MPIPCDGPLSHIPAEYSHLEFNPLPHFWHLYAKDDTDAQALGGLHSFVDRLSPFLVQIYFSNACQFLNTRPLGLGHPIRLRLEE